MTCRLIFLIVLSGMPCMVRGQCPDRVTVARQIHAIKAAPVEEWLLRSVFLKKQLDACRATHDSSYAEILFLEGYAHSLTGNYSVAARLTQASIRINQPENPLAAPAKRIQAFRYLGNYFRGNNQPAEAFDAYQQCISLGRSRTGAVSDVSRALLGQALIMYLRGDYDRATSKAQEGYQKAIYLKDKSLQAECLYELARDAIGLGQQTEAETTARRAIRFAQTDQYGTEIENVSRVILATALRNQNRRVEALREYEQVAAAYRRTGDTDQAAYVYNSIGNLYGQNRVDHQKALFYFEKAYTDFRDVSNKAISLDNIGGIYRNRKQYDRAFDYFQRALSLLPIGYTGRNSAQNPPASAIRLVSHEEVLLAIMQDKADTWLAYAKATNNRQRLRYALDTYRVVDEMIDIMRWQHVGQRSKLFWRQKTRGIYERAIETCYRLGDTEQAFHFFEKSRAVMLADKLNELGARQQLSPVQMAREQRLRQTIGERQRILSSVSADSLRYKAAQQALTVSQDSLSEFLKGIEGTNRAYYRNMYDNSVASLADLKQYLAGQRAAFVTYFEGDSARYVFSVTADRDTLLHQPKQPYQQDVKAFMHLLTDADAMNRRANLDQFLQLGQRLYQQNLAPLRLPVGRVIISPDGSFVPFETFSRAVSKPDYLVNDYAFSYTYSARFLLRREAPENVKPGLRAGGFLGIAPVTFAAPLRQVTLAGSDQALQSIADRFDVKTLLLNKAATRRAFLAQVADARIVHLFTHALADSSDREPQLFLADSSLSLSDLGDGALPNAQLVVLAACQTGTGADQRGEGVFSLARGFAALGVPSILTTLWSVDNQATYKLTNLFYHYLADGLPKDIALQRAQREWLRTTEGTDQLPTNWAGLIMVGDAQPLRETDRWSWVGWVLLVGGAGLGWWRWKHPRRRSAD